MAFFAIGAAKIIAQGINRLGRRIEFGPCHHQHISFLGYFFGVSIESDFIKLEVPFCSFIIKGANARNRAWVFIINAKFAIALGEEHARLGFAFRKECHGFDELGFA